MNKDSQEDRTLSALLEIFGVNNKEEDSRAKDSLKICLEILMIFLEEE
jgi:hypothetical protein